MQFSFDILVDNQSSQRIIIIDLFVCLRFCKDTIPRTASAVTEAVTRFNTKSHYDKFDAHNSTIPSINKTKEYKKSKTGNNKQNNKQQSKIQIKKQHTTK